ncbi:transglycosylase SLT domain-containing protein [Streptomyces sp. NPDC002870]|uniref:transglycosylase SLT domain-containing protein n=1 Tax=Streptomyces sp. NPDC002870 TaxID=3364666 RepID=UPI0036D0AB2A
MSASSTRMTKAHKVSIAGIAAAGVAALTFSLVPGNASAETETVNTATTTAAQASIAKQESAAAKQKAAAAKQKAAAAKKLAAAAAKAHAQTVAHAKVVQHAKAVEHAQAVAHAKAKANADAKKKAAAAAAKAAAKKRAVEQAASRAAARKPVFANNLDGWIKESLSIMKKHGIPGTYDGLHRNIMRESSGNPNAINNWDINAINGVPSIGLLQVIKPTFDAYHVAGTPNSQYDPVANITAAANYAADRYGSIDNVNSAY